MNHVRRAIHWVDQRVDLASLRRDLLDRKVPERLTWWHTLGSATLAVFCVQVVTGVVLAMYYSPSPDHAYDSIRFIERSVASGSLIRGIHHWGSSLMVFLVVAHMVRVFTMGAYKYPREVNWLLGVALLVIVMGMGFTGYLLPWDQKAYWATQVGTNIAGTTPVFGWTLVQLLRGGSALGAATLTRFYAMHMLLMPIALGVIVFLHIALVIRQGIAARASALEEGAPPTTNSAEYPEYYEAHTKKAKTAGVPFWPNIIFKDTMVAVGVVGVLVFLGAFVGAGLEPPADPADTSYVPRPEWYFLPFFQLLKLVPGSLESFVAVGVPGTIVAVLLLLPFFDRRSTRSLKRRPVALWSLGATTAAVALLFGASIRDAPPDVVPEVGRPLSSMERAGRTLFVQQHCSDCHEVAGLGAEKSSDAPDAPVLTEVGLRHSAAWLHSFMEDPSRFHEDSKMPAFGPPTLSHQEIEELSQYLQSLRGPRWATAQVQFADTFPEPGRAKEK